MTNIVAARIKELRLEKGYTLQQLARKVHIAIDPLTSFEQGDKIPGLEQAAKIKKVFGVSLCYLIGKVNDRKEIIDISDQFESFHINGYRNLSEEEILSARLMASDSSQYLDWLEEEKERL